MELDYDTNDPIRHVSEALQHMRETLRRNRDNEIATAGEVLSQYVTDHNDKEAYREIDRQINRLANAWDKMIARLERWENEARKIEESCENFYGD